MNHWLAALQRRLPRQARGRRPDSLIYAADESLPAGPFLLLSLQHVATVLALLAHVLAAARIAGLSLPQTHSMVAVTLLGMALGTGLQAWGGRWGSGSLLVFQPDPMMISVAGAAIAAHGPGAVVELSLVTALVTLGLGPLMRHLRPLFPPTVVGTVICMGGLGLVEPAVRNAFGLGEHGQQIDGVSVLIAGSALACIVGLSVWGGRRLRLMSLLLGILGGLLIAALAGRIEGVQWLVEAPVLALPQAITPSFTMGPGLLAAIVLIASLNQLDNIGCLTVMDKTDRADWRRADLGQVARGLRANGLADFVSGLFGSFPTAPSSANIALVHATGASARLVGLGTAALLLLIALSPKLTMALTLIPQPVLGAVELYAAAYLIVSGIEMIASRALDSRGLFMVGLSLCAGVATLLMPGLSASLPDSLRLLLGDGFVVAGLCVVGLNLLFRIGSTQQARQELQLGSETLSEQITRFVERQGAAWGARHEVVRRASFSALEAAEAIAAHGGGRVLSISGRFDEFNFDLELLHEGSPLPLRTASAGTGNAEALQAWMDAEDDACVDQALQGLSATLLRHLADRISSTSIADGMACLRLHFDH